MHVSFFSVYLTLVFYYWVNIKRKSGKCHTVGTASLSNSKIVERGTIDTSNIDTSTNTQIPDSSPY